MGIQNKSLQVGLSTIELLVTLIVASLFIAAGYSLHAFVLKDAGNARAEARANTVANEYLETYRVSSSTCTASNPLTNSPISVTGLSDVTITVAITCPDSSVTATKKVVVTLNYNTPQKTIQLSSYAGPETADTQDYAINSFFNPSAPTTPVFYWNAVTGATSYDVKYKVNAGAWSSVTNTTSTSYTYGGAEVFRNDIVYLQVTAKNGSNDLTPSKTASATVPAWTSCDLQNSWLDYGYSYNTAQFTKTSAGVVLLKGLVASGVTTSQTLICQLPVGFRPDSRLIFGNASNSASGRIDVASDGRVEFITGSNSWYTMNVTFLASTTGWTTLTSPSTPAWVDYGGTYSGAKARQDSLGRTHIQGLVKSGAYTGYSTTAYTLPANFGPTSGADLYPSLASGVMGNITISPSSGIVPRALPSNGWWSINTLIYPNAFTGVSGWQTATLSNGWVNYGSGYATAGYIKGSDGIVSLRGLIKNGTTTSWTALLTGGNKLPAGYRPKETVLCDVATSPDTFARIDVLTDGTVRIGAPDVSSSWLSLAGCDFVADQ